MGLIKQIAIGPGFGLEDKDQTLIEIKAPSRYSINKTFDGEVVNDEGRYHTRLEAYRYILFHSPH